MHSFIQPAERRVTRTAQQRMKQYAGNAAEMLY